MVIDPGLRRTTAAFSRATSTSHPSHRRQQLVAAIVGVELSAALTLDRRAAGGGRALAGTLKEQLNPSALLPALPAAKAALVALMQITSSAAVAISIVNLMAGSSPKLSRSLSFPALS
jgi:hypothetical protein